MANAINSLMLNTFAIKKVAPGQRRKNEIGGIFSERLAQGAV